MDSEVIIARRFQGPPTSGNGGYVAGRLATHVDGACAVRLRVPPPLETPLGVQRGAAGRVRLVHGELLIAEARPTTVALDVPEPPDIARAKAASRNFRGFDSHWFPSCFVCGPQRSQGDGLRVFAGPVSGRDLVAGPWTPDASLDRGDGQVAAEFVWAALDCPGAFALSSTDNRPVLLGELAVAVSGDVGVGETCTVIGWSIGRDGRKHFTGTALFDASGDCRGLGQATWFEIVEAPQ